MQTAYPTFKISQSQLFANAMSKLFGALVRAKALAPGGGGLREVTEAYRTMSKIYVEIKLNKKGQRVICDKACKSIFDALPWMEKVCNVNLLWGALKQIGDDLKSYIKANNNCTEEDYYRKLGLKGAGKKGARGIRMSVQAEAFTMLEAFAKTYDLGFKIPKMEIAKPQGGRARKE